MDHQIPYYTDNDTSLQDYTTPLQSPLAPIPELILTSNYPHPSQAQAYGDTHLSQSQLQPYQPHQERISRIYSEPIYPGQLTHNQGHMPQNAYMGFPASQHRRTLSVGANPRYLASSTSIQGLPPTVANRSQNSMRQPESSLSRADPIPIQQGLGSPAELEWPAQISVPDQYPAPPSQEQLPFGFWPPQAIPAHESEQNSYGFVEREVDLGPVGNPFYRLNQQFNSLPETYGAPNSAELNLQDQVIRPEGMPYMRTAPPHPHSNVHASWTGIHIPREVAQRFVQPPLAGPSDPAPAPAQQIRYDFTIPRSWSSYPTLQHRSPHPEVRTPACPQPQADFRQAVEPTNHSQYGPSSDTPMQPTNNYAVQFDDSDTKTYVDVGVQTEPVLFQPATRHATGKAEATTGGRNFKFVPSTATGRSNRLTSAPKRVPQAQKKLPPTQPALRPSEPSPPLPEPHMDSRTVATVATSLEGHYVPHTLGSNHPPGPQGGPSNQNLAKSMQVQQGPHPAASASTSARSTLRAPGIAIPVPSNAPTRPVHQVQELPSPYNTPDAGMHQVFNGSTATPREPIPLIHNTLSSIGSSLLVPSFASSRANCLPTPDPSPGVSGLDQQVVFPFESLRQEHLESTVSQALIRQTCQANDDHRAEGSTAHQAGVQLQGLANTPAVVPSIRIHDTEGAGPSLGRASNRGFTQQGNNFNRAPQSGSRQSSKSSSTHRQSNQFSQPSVQKCGDALDYPLAAPPQHQPTQRQLQDIQKVENHPGSTMWPTSAISQCGTNEVRQGQPELVGRDEQWHTQVCSPKRERSASETGPEQQTKRRREGNIGQSLEGAREGALERSAPQAARTDNEIFNVGMWSNPGLSQAIGGAGDLPVVSTGGTSSQSQHQQRRRQAQGWGLGLKKPCAASESTTKHAPHSHTTPPSLPTDGCSARIAMPGTPTCLMTSHPPRSNKIASIPGAIQPRAHRSTGADVENRAIDLGTPLGSSTRLDNAVIWAMQSQQPAPQVEGKVIGSPSASQPGYGLATLESHKGVEHTAVDYAGEQGQEIPIPGSATATAVQHGVTRLHGSSVLYPRSSTDPQGLNAPPSGELDFDELFGYDGVDTCGMLSDEGYL